MDQTVLDEQLREDTSSTRVDQPSLDHIHSRSARFREIETEALQSYIASSPRKDNSLTVLHGWQTGGSKSAAHSPLLRPSLRTSTGGYFLRWKGSGIAINPGEGFIENLYKEGATVHHIHHIVVTKPDQKVSRELENLHQLNYRLNQVCGKQHVIHYYLNRRSYQEIARSLKPYFKHEQGSVHPLELYVDSPEIESLELTKEIELHYFPATSPEALRYRTDLDLREKERRLDTALGLVIELKQQPEPIRIGYIAKTSWSPFLSSNLADCTTLIAGIGSIDEEDLQRTKYSEGHLGYFGCYSLLDEISPTLFILSEFDGERGDLRLEIARRLQKECSCCQTEDVTLLPADIGLSINLANYTIHTRSDPTPPNEIRVLRRENSYGRLEYLSPTCLL